LPVPCLWGIIERSSDELMGEQLFRLNGEQWDLEELAFAFQEGPATVKKLDDFHYLILETDGAKSDEERRAAGEGALKRMNAICLVRDNRFRCPTISGLSRRDPTTGKISTVIGLRCNMPARFGVRATLTVRNADGSIRPRQPTFGEHAYRSSTGRLVNSEAKESTFAKIVEKVI
jgi:hypothetical protein